MKKDKRYNTPLDNYTDKFADNFKLVVFYVVVGAIGYGVYQLYIYFF